jgi:Putative beta-barrel porin-2, OmpL-like. bbp2
MSLRSIVATAAAVCFSGAPIYPALADDQPASPAHLVWNDPIFGGIQFSGHVEGSATVETGNPANNINFGQGFNDRANTVRVNQIMINVEHDLDPKATGFDYGFKFTGMYGTDARYTHFFNEFDRVTHSPYQWDVVELDALLHAPLPKTGGIDMHIGQYPTPIGYEVIDATVNPLYSHSYQFLYSLPFKHTGILTTTHLSDTIDLWLGWDTGVNDSIGANGINNSSVGKGIIGFGLNGLLDGKLTILALAHLGPESPYTQGAASTVPDPNRYARQFYDTLITYKISDALTFVSELNWVKDDLAHADAQSATAYLEYKKSDQWSFNGRAEVYRDNQGFFVTTPETSLDVINGERGFPVVGANYNFGKATYSEFTVNAVWSPPVTLPGTLGLTIRPEARLDYASGGNGGTKIYNMNANGVGTSNMQGTFSVDAILSF